MLNSYLCQRGQAHRLTPTFIIEPFFVMLDFGEAWSSAGSAIGLEAEKTVVR